MMVLVAEKERSADTVVPVPNVVEIVDYRVVETEIHLTGGPRVQTIKNWITRVGRAEAEAMRMLKEYLRIQKVEITDEDGEVEEKIVRAELYLPCVDPAKLVAARELIKPDRVKTTNDELGGNKELSPAALARPKYLNSYHLVEIVEKTGEVPVLRFVLLETYSFEVEIKRGPKKGEKKTVKTSVHIEVTKALQRLITSWLAPPLFKTLPAKFKDGAAQEVAQSLASHLGIQEKADPTRPDIGFPSFDQADPRLCDQSKPLQHQPLRFTGSGDVTVFRRIWNDPHTQERLPGLWAAIPLDHVETWWHKKLAEFTPLPIWSGASLTTPKGKPKNLMLVPLSIRHGWEIKRFCELSSDLENLDHGRLVRTLSGKEFKPCWSLLVRRGDRFFIQLVLKREVEIPSRPNTCGVHIALTKEPHGWSIKLHWACDDQTGEILLEYPGQVWRRNRDKEGNALSGGSLHPMFDHREKRRDNACVAALKLVAIAKRLNANLYLEDVKGNKKRGQGQPGGTLATRFNHASIAEIVQQKAVDGRVCVELVPGFKLLETGIRDLSPSEKAGVIASLGLERRKKKEE